MIKKEKIKQIDIINIDELVARARETGIENKIGIIKWIISVSPYWKSKGYAEIIIAINQIRGVFLQ